MNKCENCKYYFIEKLTNPLYKKIPAPLPNGNYGCKIELITEKTWCRKYPQKIEVTNEHSCGEHLKLDV